MDLDLVQNIHLDGFRLNSYTRKNMIVLLMLIIERNKFRIGAVPNEKH